LTPQVAFRELPQAALPLFRHGRAGGSGAQSESEEKPMGERGTKNLIQTTRPDPAKNLRSDGKFDLLVSKENINI
jgi:hypothetical protein